MITHLMYKHAIFSQDYNRGREPMLHIRSELQTWGAEQLKARLPMVLRWAGGMVGWMEEGDLREQDGMVAWRRCDRHGGGILWMALNV